MDSAIHPINPYPLDSTISFPNTYPLDSNFYYIDADEIPGFFLLLKKHIFIARSEDTIISFTCEDIGVAMVTNITFVFLEQKISVLLSLFLLYNFISEFYNIFVTGILP